MAPVRCSTSDAVRILRSGGVLLLATDTLPGLHCRADDGPAAGRIMALKGRATDKPLLVLAGSFDQAEQVAGPLTSAQIAACRRCWPGPFSLILPVGQQIAVEVTAGKHTVAVRVPAVPELRELILAVGTPLVSTSANRAGDEPAGSLSAAMADFGTEIDGVWGSNEPAELSSVASALVDLTCTPPQILRPGPVTFPEA